MLGCLFHLLSMEISLHPTAHTARKGWNPCPPTACGLPVVTTHTCTGRVSVGGRGFSVCQWLPGVCVSCGYVSLCGGVFNRCVCELVFTFIVVFFTNLSVSQSLSLRVKRYQTSFRRCRYEHQLNSCGSSECSDEDDLDTTSVSVCVCVCMCMRVYVHLYSITKQPGV